MYLLIEKKRLKDTLTKKDFQFDKIVKYKNKIECYKDNKINVKIQGISNMDIFKVEGGDFTNDKLTEEEQQLEINSKLLKDSANLQIHLKKQQELNANLLIKLAQLGGNIND
ncbi:hypothetical protein [Clostridium haemolyticum]|uniref:hypothetical protein n=2 Tax=Clostridium TaxID=1485 RepID=UPI000ABFFDDF|nr:hypothetical protein [Clostridium haemolyticum]